MYIKPTWRKIVLTPISLQGTSMCQCQHESHGGGICGVRTQGGFACTPCANNHL